MAILSYAFDAVRLQSFTILWVPANLIAISIVSMVAFPILIWKRRSNPERKNQPVFNLLFVSLFFALKNLSMLWVTPLFGIVDVGVPILRFAGGLSLGVALFILFTNISVGRFEREATMSKLGETEQGLNSFRSAAFGKLEEENRIASDKAMSALTPQLEELKRSVAQSKDIVALAKKMTDFIQFELRPFSSKLAKDAKVLTSKVEPSNTYNPDFITADISLANSIRVWIAFLPVPFLFYLISSFAIPNATVFEIVLASLISLATLSLIKLSLKKFSKVSPIKALTLLTFVALLPGLPSYYFLSQIPSIGGVPELEPCIYILPGLSLLASSQAHILDRILSRVEEKLRRVILELSRENKIYEQKAWLARHGWYLLLHGVVQPCLTTASMRASSNQGANKEVRALITSDLERAIESLNLGPSESRQLAFNVAEIKSVWEGICEIDVEFDPGVELVADNQDTANRVINEILKEVVSNAIRHGNATAVKITMHLESAEDLNILVTNNGDRPVNDSKSNVGSRMLDALCLHKSLLWNEDSELTEFRALVPLKA